MTGKLLLGRADRKAHPRHLHARPRTCCSTTTAGSSAACSSARSSRSGSRNSVRSRSRCAFEDFAAALKRRKTRIKALLLNQDFLRGVGNIYADEALFRAGIHPMALAYRLRGDRPRRLYDAIVAVLTEAIAAGGSSISDYVDAEGRKGFFQISHRVYQHTGDPCVNCGTPIRRTLVVQRSSHFCPRCQKR